MVVDIRVIRVVLDSLLEALKRFRRVALLHPHTGDLDPCLGERRVELERVEEVRGAGFGFAVVDQIEARIAFESRQRVGGRGATVKYSLGGMVRSSRENKGRRRQT